MLSVLHRSMAVSLPIDIQLQFFKTLVEPVLIYGCKVWHYEDTGLLEKLHHKFCKYILGVKEYLECHGELGSYPIHISNSEESESCRVSSFVAFV